MPQVLSHKFERLPTTVVPSKYNLHFKIDLLKCLFDGLVQINLEVKESTQRIVLNSVDLELRHIELHLDDGTLFLPSKVIPVVRCQTVAILFASEVPPGRSLLSIHFKGKLDDGLRGFYRSKYSSRNGKEERYCAVTQFESCYARRCFPCWDEPAIKATFDIAVTVPEYSMALSNMPTLCEEKKGDGTKSVLFETTPLMSTYLVAIVVGEFDYVESKSMDGTTVRIYTPFGKQEQGNFALEVAVKALPYYRQYFKIPYPLPKMDLVAVGNLSAGAMENWGLITSRESCLLVDPKNTSTQVKQGIALHVAHEIAHQWFGNLVTLEWWTHLWLNEGYATFAEFLCISHLFPEYDVWTQFTNETYNVALRLDGMKSSHPIEVPVGHPLEVQEIFDDISYHKGASVIRMIHRYIGISDFIKGMNQYLSSFQYQNATTDDLWGALEEASHKPISEVMPMWTKQVGYPVITVSCEIIPPDTRKIFMKQSPFYADGISPDSEDSKQWMIPIEISSAEYPLRVAHALMLCTKELTLTIDQIRTQDWIKLNPGCFGFYRVRYSEEMMSMFKPAISDLSLPPVDRLDLLDDLFALVQAGHSSTDQLFLLLDSMRNENNCSVWNYMSHVLHKIEKLLQYADDILPLFMKYGRRLLGQIGPSVSWDPVPNETHKDKLLRHIILDLLITFEDEAAIEESKSRFEAHVNGSSILWPDIRSTVYCALLKRADAATLEIFLKMYCEETLQEEKDRIAHAFGSIGDEELLQKVLKFAVSDEVKTQSTLSVLSAMTQSLKGRDMVWEYSKQNWDKLHSRYGPFVILPHFIASSFQHFATLEMADQLQDFFGFNDASGAERAAHQTIERIQINSAWLNRDRNCIKSFLQSM